MSNNTFLQISSIARESLALLESNMVSSTLFYRDYETEYRPGMARDDTIQIRRPTNAVITNYNGSTVTPTQITETSVNLPLERHFDANIRITSRDMTLGIEDFSRQILQPYMLEMAESIDRYALTKIRDLPNYAPESQPGALPTSVGNVAEIRRVMNNLRIPTANRYAIVDPDYEAALLSIESFVEANTVGDDGTALREASLGRKYGISWFMDQNINDEQFTSGTTVAATVNAPGGLPVGTTVIPVDTTTGPTTTFVVGDILEIAGYPDNAVVAANVTASSSAANVTIMEPLRHPMSDNAGVTVFHGGGNDRNIRGAVFHSNAIALAAVPLALPSGAGSADYIQDRGFGIRAVYDYDRNLKSDILSLDILVGAAVIDGRLGAQLVSNI